MLTGLIRSAFLIVLLILLGCSADRSKQITYNAERIYHQAEKLFETASIKPNLGDTATWSGIKNGYLNSIRYCWIHLDSLPADKFPQERQGLESVAYLATTRLASIYFAEQKIDSAIALLQQLLSLTNLTGRALLSTQSNLAQAYLASGDWDGGMEIYRSMIDTFYPPVDNNNEIINEVLGLPIELINIYRRLQFPEEKEAVESAREYYQRLIREWPDSELERAARLTLARFYANEQEWDESIETLSNVKDSTGQLGIPESMKIAEIYADGKNDYKAAIEIYKDLIKRVTDTTRLVTIYIRTGIAYYDDGQYAKCRETMDFIKKRYYGYFMSNPVPQDFMAKSFDREDNWERAEEEYFWLISNFPESREAFDAYLTIARHYDEIDNEQLSESWYRRAEEFYSRMQSQHAGTPVAASAISYKAEIARLQENWDRAAQLLEELYRRFPEQDVGRRGLVNAIHLYREKLDNPARADSLEALINPET
jgi:tetratricopeptide (TPR) repeat protein